MLAVQAGSTPRKDAAVPPATQGRGPQSLIGVADLVVRYSRAGKPDKRLALDGASLTVSAGEMVVILGANGSGKSTLLRAIAGILRPVSGSISVGGHELTNLTGRTLAEARMELGMVFQHANLVKRRNVLANVLTGTLGRHRTWSSALGILPRQEVSHARTCLAEVGLLDLAFQRAGTLSGGQAQRVSIARALAQAPRALLADEPVASLDPEAAEEVMRLLRRISCEDGLGVLCVLHQPELARRYANRIVGLRNGRVAFADRSSAIRGQDVAALYEGLAA